MKKLDKVVLFTDGGARGNPGPAGIGIVIKDPEGNELFKHGEYIGETTNNQAEYAALVKGLDFAANYTLGTVEANLDSELVVKQLRGEYRMKEPTLFPLQQEVFKHQKKFKVVNFVHITRDKNAEADELVNKALDETSKNFPR